MLLFPLYFLLPLQRRQQHPLLQRLPGERKVEILLVGQVEGFRRQLQLLHIIQPLFVKVVHQLIGGVDPVGHVGRHHGKACQAATGGGDGAARASEFQVGVVRLIILGHGVDGLPAGFRLCCAGLRDGFRLRDQGFRHGFRRRFQGDGAEAQAEARQGGKQESMAEVRFFPIRTATT